MAMASPQSIEAANTRAVMLKDEGKYGEARDYLHHALRAARETLMDDDPIFLSIIFNLSALLQLTGKFEEAEPLAKEVLKLRMEYMGPDAKDTIGCRINMATLHENLGRMTEALEERAAVVEALKRTLGEDDKDTLAEIGSLGRTCLKAGKLEAALGAFTLEVTGHVKRFGPGCQNYLPAETIAAGKAMADALAARPDQGKGLQGYMEYLAAWKAVVTRDPEAVKRLIAEHKARQDAKDAAAAADASPSGDPQPKLHPGSRPFPFEGFPSKPTNDEFKAEVERMVKQQQTAAGGGGASAAATGGSSGGSEPAAPSRALPLGSFASTAALLSPLGLDKYVTLFDEEEMDPDTLISVLQQQGRSALDEALKELGVKSMGHRLKILNALLQA